MTDQELLLQNMNELLSDRQKAVAEGRQDIITVLDWQVDRNSSDVKKYDRLINSLRKQYEQ